MMLYSLKTINILLIGLLEVGCEEVIRLDRARVEIINEVLHIVTQVQHRVGELVVVEQIDLILLGSFG